jgi:hypothetical protein
MKKQQKNRAYPATERKNMFVVPEQYKARLHANTKIGKAMVCPIFK